MQNIESKLISYSNEYDNMKKMADLNAIKEWLEFGSNLTMAEILNFLNLCKYYYNLISAKEGISNDIKTQTVVYAAAKKLLVRHSRFISLNAIEMIDCYSLCKFLKQFDIDDYLVGHFLSDSQVTASIKELLSSPSHEVCLLEEFDNSEEKDINIDKLFFESLQTVMKTFDDDKLSLANSAEFEQLFHDRRIELRRFINRGIDAYIYEVRVQGRIYALKVWRSDKAFAFHDMRTHVMLTMNECTNVFPCVAAFRVYSRHCMLMEIADGSLQTMRSDSTLYFQVIYALVLLNEQFEFNHNDLHPGNVLVRKATPAKIMYGYKKNIFLVPNQGFYLNITDFSRSVYTYKSKRYGVDCLGELLVCDRNQPLPLGLEITPFSDFRTVEFVPSARSSSCDILSEMYRHYLC